MYPPSLDACEIYLLQRPIRQPGPEHAHNVRIVLLNDGEEVLNDLHVSHAKPARRTMPVHISLGCMMVYGISSAVSLKRAVGASGKCLVARCFEHFERGFTG